MIKNVISTLLQAQQELERTIAQGGSVREFWEVTQLTPYVLSASDIEQVVQEVLGIDSSFDEFEQVARQDFVFFRKHPEENEISVETMRRAITSLQMAAGDFVRVVVFAQFDAASEQAHNAFLKTLEDGVPGVIFLLQCDSTMGLLETVRSRVMVVSSDSIAAVPSYEVLTLARRVLRADDDALAEALEWAMQEREEAVLFVKALIQSAEELRMYGVIPALSETLHTIITANTSPKYLLDSVLIRILVMRKG
jgi:hypothetical protein